MTVLQDLEDIFCIFHDGSAEFIRQESTYLHLKISCEYLAELIQPGFQNFFLDLENFHSLSFTTWHIDKAQKSLKLAEVNEVFGDGIGILQGKITNNYIEVFSDIRYGDIQNDGGLLTIGADGYKLFDQDKNLLTLEALKNLSRRYWNDF